MIFALNVSAFLYFAFDFTRQYLSHETVSIERVERPITIDRPAITFCNANRRRRRYVCNIYPHKCVFFNSEEEVCSRYPRYCNYLNMYKGVYTGNPVCQDDDCYTWWETVSLFEEFIINSIDNNYKHSTSDKIYTKVPFTDNEGEASICFSYGLKYPIEYSKVNRTIFNKKLKKGAFWNKENKIETWNDIIFLLQIEIDDYLDPVETPSVYFAIHDSTRLVNPFKYGIKLGVPRSHLIQVNYYIEQQLLPYPYDTNCQLLNPEGNTDETFDLTECIESCKFNLHMKQYGCAARSISISHMVKLCKKDEKVSKENQEICFKKCNVSPCVSRMYKYKHMENVIKAYGSSEEFRNNTNEYLYNQLSLVSVSFRNMRARYTKFAPKMVPIDLFSNIGGFLGIWIGSSVISISDLLYRLSDYLLNRAA
ncbi:degenerin del-1-like [Parasteatoda tepidariorum]|uniref:degenerin del-1-like n=1 Tax=Parasteatoda tepidariorum TaxID=114398 RepID=UPI0039BCC385